MKIDKKRPGVNEWLLFFLSLFIIAGLSEGTLQVLFPEGVRSNRLYGWEWLAEDPVLGWRNRPHYQHRHFQINSLGFRGPEIEREKPAGVIRIICLGDSRTFGIRQVMGEFLFDNDYPSILQSLISEASPQKRVEVINAGVIGYTSSHGLRTLKSMLLDLNPDILIVAFGFNEFLLSWTPEKRLQEPSHPISRRLFYRLISFRTFQLALAAYRKIAFLHDRPAETRWVTEREYKQNLREFAVVASKNKIRLLFLKQELRDASLGETLPAHPSQDMKTSYQIMGMRDRKEIDHYLNTYDAILEKVAAQAGVPVVDGFHLSKKDPETPFFDPYDMVHANRHGAEAIATMLYKELNLDLPCDDPERKGS